MIRRVSFTSVMHQVFVCLVVGFLLLAGGTTASKKPAAVTKVQLRHFHKALASPSWRTRQRALVSMAKLAPRATQVIPLLRKALNDRHKAVCVAAIKALRAFGPKARQAAPGLIQVFLLRGHRTIIGDTLIRIGPSARAPLLRLLQHKSQAIRFYAIVILGHIRPYTKDMLAPLIKAFLAPQPRAVSYHVSNAARGVLVKMGKMAIPSLLQSLRTHPRYAPYIVETIGYMGPKAKPPLPAMIRVLTQTKAKNIQRRITSSIASVGPQATGALLVLLRHRELRLRRLAVETLSTIYSGRQKSPSELFSGAMMRAQNKGKSLFEKELANGGSWGLGTATSKLVRPKGAKCLRAFMQALQDSDDRVKSGAMYLLSRMKAEAAPAIPLLVGLLKSRRSYIRSDAAMALGGIGKEPQKVIPLLIEMLKQPHRHDPIDIARALGAFGRPAAKATPVILQRLLRAKKELKGHKKHIAGLNYIVSLGKIGRGVLPFVTPWLQSKEKKKRLEALSIIRCLGPKARALSAVLQTLTKDKAKDIRDAAKMALKCIKKYGCFSMIPLDLACQRGG